MDNLVSVRDLTKHYANKTALDGLTLDIAPGHIVGLLGPNGSGKTTFLKIVGGLMQPSSGQVTLPGGGGRRSKAAIAFMPANFAFPGWMRVSDALGWGRAVYLDYDEALALELLRLAELRPADSIRFLSRGMKERVTLCLTLARRAKLFLLDEPLGSIDPVEKSRVLDAILARDLDDASVVVSTHLIRDIERIFDEVYLIGRGRLLYHGACDELRAQSGMAVEQKYMEVFGHVE